MAKDERQGTSAGAGRAGFLLYSAALGALAALPAVALEIAVSAFGITRAHTVDAAGALQIYVAHGFAMGLASGVGWALVARVLGRPTVARRDALATGVLLPGIALVVVLAGMYLNHVALPGFTHPLSLAVNAGVVLLAAAACGVGVWRITRIPSRPGVPRVPLLGGLVLFCAAGIPFLLRFLPPSLPASDRPESIATSVAPLPEGAPFAGDVPVFVLLIDTLRADHLSVYGYERETSPALDRFARDAVLYTAGYSTSSWTLPSVASLFLGLYPTTHTVIEAWSVLPSELHTLAEAVKALGYPTAAFVANPLVDADHGYFQGMDQVFPPPAPRWLQTHPNALQMVYRAVLVDRRPQDAPTVFAAAKRWLASRTDARVFTYVHLFEPHGPYEPPGKFASRYDPGWEGPPMLMHPDVRSGGSAPTLTPAERTNLIAQYDGEIAYMDTQLAGFFDHLEAEGLYDPALIVLVADHGEEFYDHQSWGHGDSAHQELTRVPFAIKWPGGRFAGTRVETPVQLVDVKTTVLHALGHAPTSHQDGRSLLTALEGGDGNEAEATAFVETVGWHQVRTRDWRYLIRRDAEPGSGMLFAGDDLREEVDVAARHPEVVTDLERRRSEWIAGLGDLQVEEQSVPLDETRRQQLRELGYLDE